MSVGTLVSPKGISLRFLRVRMDVGALNNVRKSGFEQYLIT